MKIGPKIITVFLFFSAVVSPVFAADDSLIGHWTMDEGSFQDVWVIDQSGRGNNGKLIEQPIRGVPGKLKEAIGLNGTRQYIHIEAPMLFQDVKDQLTVAAWAKPSRNPRGLNESATDATAWDQLFGAGLRRSTLNTLQVGIDLNYHWNATIHAGGVQLPNLVSKTERLRDEWQHLALTYDGKAAILYVNGQAVDSGEISGNLDFRESFFGIGAKSVQGSARAIAGEFFEGEVDEVRFYNRALGASEIADLFALKEPERPVSVSIPASPEPVLPVVAEPGGFVLPTDVFTTEAVVIGDLRAAYPTFTRTLTIGSFDQEVLELQKYLNRLGFKLAESGAGSPGSESKYFGALTAEAVRRYQQANGISPASGFVGPLTRAKLNASLGGAAAPVVSGSAGGLSQSEILAKIAELQKLLQLLQELQAKLKVAQGV